MPLALFDNLGGIPFWTAPKIRLREQAIQTLEDTLTRNMTRLNSAWTLHRVEGPLLTPRDQISASYDETDIFMLKAKLGEKDAALRAETTASSYAYAEYLVNRGLVKYPFCVWQVGKSFRVEAMDGARASTLRFNEFYQCEFQFIYKNSTLADIRGCGEVAAQAAIKQITHSTDIRMVDSDRLPSYSTATRDVEVPYLREGKVEWKEMASISTRTDFPREDITVLEVAVGLDRLVEVAAQNLGLED